MKINYELDSENRITSYTVYPFDETKPYIEVKDYSTIKLNVDKVLNGTLFKGKDDEVKAKIEKFKRINELKKLLAESDYKCLKYIDGELTEEEYSTIKTQRKSWREEINSLEKELEG